MAVIQAFVFGMLTMVFMAMATRATAAKNTTNL
jgi:F0F1-type ATP synthase membrane subunit a